MNRQQLADILIFRKYKKTLKLAGLAGLAVTCVIMSYFLWIDLFNNPEILQVPLSRLGFFAPLVFFLLSIVNAIYPIFPGGISNIIGFAVFGPVKGFGLIFVANLIGTFILFGLARRYGKPLLYTFFDRKHVKKALTYLDKFSIEWILAIVYIVPGLPDDVFTLIAGVGELSPKRLLLVQLIFKPLTMYLYVMGFSNIFALLSASFK